MSMVVGSFELDNQLGHGSFGTVYKGTHITTGLEVAVKLGHPEAPLGIEQEALQTLAGGPGIPQLHESGRHHEQDYIAVDLLGPTLKAAFRAHNYDFSGSTIAMIAEQLITCLEYVHSKGIIHQDIKPSNILLGRDSNSVYLADFGLASVWDPASYGLGPQDPGEGFEFIGSVTWSCKRAHRGTEWWQTRGDDLESLGYTCAYLDLGYLPWQDDAAFVHTEDQHHDLYLAKRRFVNHEGLRDEVATYLRYCNRELGSRQRQPDYDYLRCLFMSMCFVDGVPDWTWDLMDVVVAMADLPSDVSDWSDDFNHEDADFEDEQSGTDRPQLAWG